MRFIRSLISLLLAAVLLVCAYLVWKKLSEGKLDTDDGAKVEAGNQLTQSSVDMAPQISYDGDSFSAKITEAQLAVLLEKAIGESVPVKSISAKIGDEGRISFSCKVDAPGLTQLLIAGEKPLPDTVKDAITLVSDTIDVDMAGTLAMAVSEVAFIPEAFGVFGLSLGAGLMPDKFAHSVNRYLNEYIKENVGNITSVGTVDGIMTVEGKK